MQAGIVQSSAMLMEGWPFPKDQRVADIFINDLVLMSVVDFQSVDGRTLRALRRSATKRVELPRLDPRPAAVDEEWQRCGLPQSAPKATHAPQLVDVWGAQLDAVEGVLGFPACRRASLMLTGVTGLARGMSGAVLQQLLGGLAFALSFRHEGFATLGEVYSLARAVPRQKPLRLQGQAACEIALLPAMRWRPACGRRCTRRFLPQTPRPTGRAHAGAELGRILP